MKRTAVGDEFECLLKCSRNSKCLSANVHLGTNNAEHLCELNNETRVTKRDDFKRKAGSNYYGSVRGITRQSCSEPFCENNGCDSLPCQNGGTCRGLCDVDKRRFNCTCPPGFTGLTCQIKLSPRSCKEVMAFNKENNNGNYSIVDQQNISFPVYCDFGSEPGVAWTLIQSYSFQNISTFRGKAFYLHDMPVNQDAPEWDNYRLSKSRMKSIQDVSTHWRATCNFPTDGVDYRDYWRVSLHYLDLVTPSLPGRGFCLETEYVNVHGIHCSNCTVWCGYSAKHDLHLDSYHGNCDLKGGIEDEDSFGFYSTINPKFRCTSSQGSTTQFWLGTF